MPNICSKKTSLSTAYANHTKEEIKALDEFVDNIDWYSEYWDGIWHEIKENEDELIPPIMTCAGIN